MIGKLLSNVALNEQLRKPDRSTTQQETSLGNRARPTVRSCDPTMELDNCGPDKTGPRNRAAQTATDRWATTFTKASKLPRGESATGSLESRIEASIKQLSLCARQSDDEWLTAALAAMVADLERLWAHAAGIGFSDFQESTRQRSLASGEGDSA